MAARRRLDMEGSTDDLGDNLFTPDRTQPPTTSGDYDAPTGMPGTQGNPNTGVAGGGLPPPPQTPQLPQVPIVGTGTTQPTTTPTWNAGARAGQGSTILGFDSTKLSSPTSGQAAGSKYTDASKAFAESINQDVGWTRGAGNENAINFLRANGFENAKMVGDDKVDFGDGNGPIDIFRSDGALVFQNTKDNPVWEAQGYQPDTASGPTLRPYEPAAPQAPSASTVARRATPAPTSRPTPRPLDGIGEEPGVRAQPPGLTDSTGEGNDDNSRIEELLRQFLSGDVNQGIIDRRVDGARDVLNKQRSSAVDTLGASLAERGQIGSGAGESAQVRLDQALNDDFAGEVNSIYANEGENADQRLLQALITSAGMEEGDADRLIEQFKADTGRIGTLGDLDVRGRSVDNQGRQIDNDYDLGLRTNDTNNRRIDTDYDLGLRTNATNNRRIDSDQFLGVRGQDLSWSQFLGQLGLDRDELALNSGNSDWDHILRLLELQLGGANTSADGYI